MADDHILIISSPANAVSNLAALEPLAAETRSTDCACYWSPAIVFLDTWTFTQLDVAGSCKRERYELQTRRHQKAVWVRKCTGRCDAAVEFG